jgi:hypothetical protein
MSSRTASIAGMAGRQMEDSFWERAAVGMMGESSLQEGPTSGCFKFLTAFVLAGSRVPNRRRRLTGIRRANLELTFETMRNALGSRGGAGKGWGSFRTRKSGAMGHCIASQRGRRFVVVTTQPSFAFAFPPQTHDACLADLHAAT